MNKNNHIKILASLALVVLCITPTVADAAWYNPFSWFKKKPATPAIINNGGIVPGTATTTLATPTATTSTTTKKENKVTPTLPPTAKPPVKTTPGTLPVQAQPATSSKDVKSTTTTSTKIVEVPSFAATSNFQATNFTQGFSLRTGTELLAVEAKAGGTIALGNWYVDSIVWKIVAPDMRDGDIVISVSSKQNIVSESGLVNTLITTKLSAHVASDELSFKIGGNVPNRGRVSIVVEEMTGRVKNDPTNTVYTFKGLPVVGPEFSL